MSTPLQEKQDLRPRMLAELKTQKTETLKVASQRAVHAALNHDWWKMSSDILAYWPMARELDLKDLLYRGIQEKKKVFLPRIQGKYLEFRRWLGNESLLEASSRGFQAILPGAELWSGQADSVFRPTLVLVPGLAFDRRGGRLGRGGGFYDRFLTTLKKANNSLLLRTLGCGFSVQMVDQVPQDIWDQNLDGLLTEGGLLLTEKD